MYFRTINNGTKKAIELIENYFYYTKHNGFRNIWQAYGSPSVYKVRAWNEIADLCREMNGYGLSVLGKNCMKYSAGFRAVVDGVEKLFYFTADNSYEIEL